MDTQLKNFNNEARTKCEIWTRVMGYHRPITSWNTGKKQEYKDRKVFIPPNDEQQ